MSNKGRPVTSATKKDRKRREEYRQEQLHEKLAAFEELEQTVLPALRKLLAGGATPDEMRTTLAPYLEARKLSIALTSKDEGRALAAIQDAQNRIEGKPKERQEVEHKFSKLKDEELDALLESRLKEVDSEDSDDSDTIQ